MKTHSARITRIAALAALLLLPGALLAQTSPNIEEIIREQTMEAFTPIPAVDPDLLVSEGGALPLVTKAASTVNCFPTCDSTDGRFLVIAAGAAFNSFSDQAQFFRVAAEAGTTSFTLGVFDGDARGLAPLTDSYWDLGAPAVYQYTLFADPLDDGSGTTVVPLSGQPSVLSTSMLNNDWTDFTVVTDAAAQAPSGAFFYQLKIELLDLSAVTMNAFKLRTSGQVTADPQVLSYIANFSSFVDGLLLYPAFPSPTPSTYDGSFNFFFEAPADQADIVIWDGDFDHGSYDFTNQDTDDPDTPGAPFLPPFSSGDAVPEGVAMGEFGTTGAPRDDMDPNSGAGFGTYQLRTPAIQFNVVTPDNQVFANTNPSGNQEWEQFRITLGPPDPTQADFSTTSLPAGTYQVNIQGVDLQNLNAILLPFRALCVDEFGAPCPTGIRPFLVGDTVFYDVDGDGVQGPGELGIADVTVTLLSPGGQVLGTATTDTDGMYSFTVVAGEYTVEVDASNFDAGGALEDTTSTTGDSLTFTVVNDNILDYDFGYLSNGSIGDFVWRDLNGDGVQDAGEPGIEGVTVTLEADVDGDGAIDFTQTAVTDVDGLYGFDNLPPGSYTVTVDATTLPADAGDQTFDLDGDLDNTTTVDLALGEERTDVDFGYLGVTYTIGDTVFYDVDGDGTQGSGELGVPGVTVSLLDSEGQVLETATTDTNGNYSFTVPPGEHTVVVDSTNFDAGEVLEGTTSTTGDSLTFTVVDADVLDYDFGYLSSGSIGDFVWKDLNADGVQDAGEPGIEGVTLTLEADVDGDGAIDFTQTAVTDAAGLYLFDNLPPGTYTVTVDASTLPADATLQTFDLDGVLDDTTTVNLGQGEDRIDVDFGYVEPASVGDRVWLDTNGNGLQDDGATGVNGVTVNLFDSAGVLVATMVTSGDGNYNFSGLPPGNYTVSVDPAGLPAGAEPTFDADGIATPNTSVVSLSAGENNLEIDFGYTQDSICLDTFDFESDANGVQLVAGQIIDDEWASLGVHVTTNDPSGHPAMIFDSANPTGGDPDLGTPNQDFGGPGVGSGGEAGEPGENALPLGHVLILSEDGDSSDPDDNAGGGTLIFTFDVPVFLDSVGILDIDEGAGGMVTAYDAGGNMIVASAILDTLGDNSVQTVMLEASGVRQLEVEFSGSGAVSGITFCPETKSTCLDDVDFESDANGSQLAAGQIIDDEWASLGIQVTTNDPASHPAMIFDSANPTGGDPDLGTPNQDFGGPGVGNGGRAGQPGENALPLGKVLIISEDGDSSDPDDNGSGGTLIFTFDIPVFLNSVGILDIDEGRPGMVTAYDDDGNMIVASAILDTLGDNSVQTVMLDASGVRRLEVELSGSGAVSVITFCEDTPPPGECQPKTVSDDLNSGTYSGSTGPDDWAGPWIEDDPQGGGANSGQVRMVGNDFLVLDDYPNTGGEPSATREVDLSGTVSATLRFGFDTSSGVDANDAVTVEISADGGASWTVLEVITGITGVTWEDRNFDISDFISEQTQVRFRVSNKYGGRNEYFFLGEVEISASCDAAPRGSITGTIWNDSNGDGAQQDSGAGLSDVKVQLFQDGNFLAFTVTDGEGRYSFPEREAGSYEVRVETSTLPSGIDVPTHDLDGIATPDRAGLELAAGQDLGNADFGYQAPAGPSCTSCDYYNGSLRRKGSRDIQPNNTYYYSRSGTHQGWLEGPSNADFDLALYKWNGRRWSRVAYSGISGSSEHISYNGSSGYYLWTVKSHRGNGDYELGLEHP